jgi:hypothetical protein
LGVLEGSRATSAGTKLLDLRAGRFRVGVVDDEIETGRGQVAEDAIGYARVVLGHPQAGDDVEFAVGRRLTGAVAVKLSLLTPWEL